MMIKPHFCPNCSRSYKRRDSVARHLKYECGKEPQFQCFYCPKKFAQKCNLKYHMSAVH